MQAGAAPSEGCAPATFNFDAAATAGTAPYAYHWTFGDGGSSDEQNPSHTYASAGTYEAVVTISDAHNCGVASDKIIVTVWPTPLADASATPLQGCAPILVRFSGSATGGTEGYSFHWEFGDGDTSDEQNPEHIYLNIGTYAAKLTVTDAHGCTGEDTVNISLPCFSLTLAKTEDKDPLCPLDHIRYRIVLHNGGALPLNGVHVVDTLPTGTYYVASDVGGTGSYGDPNVVWDVNVAPGASVSLYLEAGTNSGVLGSVTNHVTASIYRFSTTVSQETTIAPCAGPTPSVPTPGFPACPNCTQVYRLPVQPERPLGAVRDGRERPERAPAHAPGRRRAVARVVAWL